MIKTEPMIRNSSGEKLDTWVESPEEVKANVVLVHGFGTSKHESLKYFDDITTSLVDDGFRVIRFDLSGYGKSEGDPVGVCYSKHVGDLQSVLNFVTENFHEKVFILAQSMGCFVTTLTLPTGVDRILMTGIPNASPQFIVDRFSKRYGSKLGGKIDIKGISLLPRSSGEIQQIGPQFWADILALDPIGQVTKLSLLTKLKIIHWNQDEVLGRDYLEDYNKIKTLESVWLDGDHSVSKPADRANFIRIMLKYFNQK